MKILPTRRSDYGIRALVWMARAEDRSTTAAQIADEMEIPKGFLHQVLLGLRRAGIVASRTGRTGGYRLAKPAAEISVLEVMEALEGPIENGECAMKGGPCHWDDVCPMHWVWSSARNALVEKLKDASLADIAEADAALLTGQIPVPPDAHRS